MGECITFLNPSSETTVLLIKHKKRKQQFFKDNDDQAYRDSVNIISITVTKSQKHTA